MRPPAAPGALPRSRESALIARTPLVGVMRGVGADVTDADDAFLAIVGYTRADFEGGRMNWRAMTPRQFLPRDEAGIRQAAEGGGFTAPYQKEFIRKDGSRVPVLLVCAFVPDTPGTWIGYVVDLSPPAALRAPAESARMPLGEALPQEFYSRLVNELVRERTRIVGMLDNTDALLWAVDPDYRLLGANDAFQRAQRLVTGRDLDIGESVMARGFPQAARDQWSAWYQRALQGERFTVRTSHERPDGAIVHHDHVLSPILDPQRGGVGVTVVSQDVTTRTLTEEALRASEARFRTLTAASPLGIFLTDTAGECIYANPRLTSIWRLSAQEMLGRGYARHIHPDDVARVMTEWQTAIRVEGAMEIEYRLAFPDRTERQVRLRIAPIHEGDRFTGFVGTVDDDTERHALARRLRQSEKMQSLGTLAGGIAHDFNNMLGVVLGYAELSLADAAGLPQLSENLHEIRTASLRARELVKQILTFSRRSEQVHTPVDLRALTDESLRLLRATLPVTVTLDAHLPDAPVTVLGDATSLQQVIVNLCTNAEYAMRRAGGGTLYVRLEAAIHGGAAQAVLTVRDTGEGLHEAVRERLFEPFFTTKPVGEGTGMGLAVVHGIVEAHGGTIAVESAPGAGATFRVVLPLTTVVAPVAATAPPESRGIGRVLLVEDEPALARFAEQALRRAGYTVVYHRNGGAALQAFTEAPDTVDVVVSDVAMPGLTGDRLAEEVHRVRAGVPVILMTGFSHTVRADNAHVLGIAALLQKPFSARELVATVGEVLARAGG